MQAALEADDQSLQDIVIAVASGRFGKDELTAYLRERLSGG
ncbi:MAG: hypothetical protein ACE37H_02250 [Phycisphaeraceae bacterium]